MKRHKFTKWNKERLSVYASAALIVCVCVVSGIYAGSQSPSKKQIIDLESLEDDSYAYESGKEEQALANEEETVPVVTNGQTAIPTDAREAMENAANAEKTDAALAADLTGDAEMEIVEVIDEDEGVPTMAESSSQEAA